MRTFIKNIFLISYLILLPMTSYGSWSKLSDIELVNQSDVIVKAELVGQTKIMINFQNYFLGILRVKETLKGSGNKNHSHILLALPQAGKPRVSTDIFYLNGQKGLWFLRNQKIKGESGIYLADHPQRFLPSNQAEDKIKVIKRILEDDTSVKN